MILLNIRKGHRPWVSFHVNQDLSNEISLGYMLKKLLNDREAFTSYRKKFV